MRQESLTDRLFQTPIFCLWRPPSTQKFIWINKRTSHPFKGVPRPLTWAYKSTAGFLVSPSAFPSYCTLAAHAYFSITRAFPFNCRSIGRVGRIFSLASWQRRESEQTGYQGRKLHRSFYYYKNWDPRTRVSLISLQLLFLLTARATVSAASRITNNYQLFTALFSKNSTQIISVAREMICAAKAAKIRTTQQQQAQGTVSNSMPCLCLNLL